MKDATGVQWFFLLSNVIAIGVMVFALVDCCRHKLRKKALWILLIVFGILSFGATFSSTGFHVNFNLGSITAYSALVRYGSGRIMLRLMLPVGAIIYWAMRRSLLNKITPSITPCETEPEVFTEESNTAPSSSQTPQDEQT